MPKEPLSKYNFFITAILAVIVLGYLIFSSKSDTNDGRPNPEQNVQSPSGSSSTARAPQAGRSEGKTTAGDSRPFSLNTNAGQSSSPSMPADLPEDMVRALNSPPPPLPPDLEAQLNAPPPELPEDLKRQLNSPPPPLPPDMQAQLNSPPPALPEDIKRSLATPPRIVTLDEVNTPKAAAPESSAGTNAESDVEASEQTQ